jgi:hypothetical protein
LLDGDLPKGSHAEETPVFELTEGLGCGWA